MNILFVEDDPALLPTLRAVLEDAGHDVDCAGTAEEALKLASQSNHEVLLTDVRLPGLSGVDLARAARRKNPEVWIILISGAPDEVLDEFYPRATFLAKPFDMMDLEDILTSIQIGLANPGDQR